MHPNTEIHSVSIVAPCFNEGINILSFLELLESKLRLLPYRFHVVVVDDFVRDKLVHSVQYS